jgi:hypothetical protein
MTDAALVSEMADGGNMSRPDAPPPLKPNWLRPVTTAAIVLAHLAVAGLLMKTAVQNIPSLDSVSMDLVPEGDYIEQEEVSQAEDTPPPEEVEQPDLALPPPMVMAPDAVPLPAKKEVVQPVKKKVVERKEIERARERRVAQQRRRAGAPGGRAQGSGHSQSICLAQVASAIRRHTPGATSLGAGHATVTLHVHAGGGISVGGASGSTPAHAALARRIVASSRGPSICGAGTFTQGFSFH